MIRAFSLIELSIVLVILGLLTGGILAGQSLIRAAELRSVITEYQRFATATRTFQDKYFALPGDMREATLFWPIGTGSGQCGSTTADDCDGDGHVEWYPSEGQEGVMYWRQLAAAGLISGEYSGICTGANCEAVGGSNVPESKSNDALWSIRYFSDPNVLGNTYDFGSAVSGSLSGGPTVLTSEEA